MRDKTVSRRELLGGDPLRDEARCERALEGVFPRVSPVSWLRSERAGDGGLRLRGVLARGETGEVGVGEVVERGKGE